MLLSGTMSMMQWFGIVSLGTFFAPFLVKSLLHRPQNLKKKYNAEWALVTGSSSGIGKALTERLCEQGLNVVMVAIEDDTLKKAHEEIKKKYPSVQIRCVGADLSKEGYMKKITDATDDIVVSCIFNNAGYIMTGMFADVPLEKVMCNYDCNSTCAVKITHHFVNKLLDADKKGLVVFTSSPAGCFPSPCASMYGATKAFLTSFASSIAAELRSSGIDVTVIHPSPVGTRFYEKVHKMPAISFFQSTATGPHTIADFMLANAGRSVVAEQGYFCVVLRGLVLKLIDFALLADIIARFSHMSGDFKAVHTKRVKKQ